MGDTSLVNLGNAPSVPGGILKHRSSHKGNFDNGVKNQSAIIEKGANPLIIGS